MKKINIIQFMPYFPPHKGGLETVGEEIGKHWIKKDYGNFINVVFDVGQKEYIKNMHIKTGIYHKQKFIGYRKDGYSVLLIPSFDLINTFPFPKFWEKRFWVISKLLKRNLNKSIVITHTRFFLSSLVGGIFARRNKLKWVHIEHGSDYVKASSNFVSKVSYLYDKIIGKWIFKKADKVVGISEAVKGFILKEFLDREVEVVYNGINFNPGGKIDNGNIIKIGFVGRLVNLKGIDLLVDAFNNLSNNYKNIELIVVGDGEERKKLEIKAKDNINFLGFKNKEYIEKEFLPTIDILVNPSYQEGLPTTVIEGLISSCIVVATDVGGTKEISNLDDLILVKKGNKKSIEQGIEKAILNYKNLGGKSRELVKKKFDWNKNIREYYDLFENLI